MNDHYYKLPPACDYDVASWDRWSKERLESAIRRASRAKRDSHRKRRLAARECKVCFHIDGPRIACAAFTNWTCRLCSKDGYHPNTAVPRICDECSDERGMCVTCGAKID